MNRVIILTEDQQGLINRISSLCETVHSDGEFIEVTFPQENVDLFLLGIVKTKPQPDIQWIEG